MIKPHSRCVSKATHTLSNPGRFSVTPLKSKRAGHVFPQPTVWSLATKCCPQQSHWLPTPHKVLVIIYIIFINSDNIPIYSYFIINVHLIIIIINFSECICYAIEFGSVVNVNPF